MATAFASGAKPFPEKSKLISKLGEYAYFVLVLAGFDPSRAAKIQDDCDHEQVARAYIALIAHNAIPKG